MKPFVFLGTDYADYTDTLSWIRVYPHNPCLNQKAAYTSLEIQFHTGKE